MATPQRKRPMPHNVLQEYLEALADGMDQGPTVRQERALFSYAELQYQLHGGGRCSMCRASVRHVLPVTVEHTNGTIAEFACLCTRCLQGERAVSDRVILTVGVARLEYATHKGEPETRSFSAYTT